MKRGRRGIFLEDLPPAVREKAERQYREEIQKGIADDRQSPAPPVLPPSAGSDSPKGLKRGKKRREMNATEREFFAYLKREYPDAEGVEYEKHTLRWGEGPSLLSYTPDFVVRFHCTREFSKPYLRLVCFEVKGAHAWKQDIVRFKAAVTHFDYLEFQLWEKDADGRWHHTI